MPLIGSARGEEADRARPPNKIAEVGSQCGFCTPGMIMAAKALLDQNPSPSVPEIKQALANNLCRCTGYNTIVESVQYAVEKMGVEGRG